MLHRGEKKYDHPESRLKSPNIRHNRSLKRHMVSGSRCPIYLIRCLGYMVNRAAAPEGPMTYDSTEGNFHFNDFLPLFFYLLVCRKGGTISSRFFIQLDQLNG